MKFGLPSPTPSVIIVDDSTNLIRVYARFFEIAGLHVFATFPDGRDVVEYFHTINLNPEKAELARRCVILMDYRMTDMDGIEAAREIRKMEDGNPTIILATSDEISELSIPKELFDGVLRKPFSMEDFANMLAKISTSKKRKSHPDQAVESAIGHA